MRDYFNPGEIYTKKAIPAAISDAKGLVPHNNKSRRAHNDVELTMIGSIFGGVHRER
jgi:hypothetical protein